MTDWLTTEEAAARLGVKRETLYAYVSRGLVHREMHLDGRSSCFDPVEIDRLRDRARRTASGELSTIIATRITRLSDDGHTYRGRSAIEMAASGMTFEAVADHLWQDDAPWPEPGTFVGGTPEPGAVPPLDRFRIAVARASAADKLRADLDHHAVAATGRRVVHVMVDALPPLGDHPEGDDHPEGAALADRLWSRLSPVGSNAVRRDVLNAALVLLADHGLAASTFAVRVAASVRCDPYSAVSTGLGVVAGQLHGAASGGAHRLFDRAVALGSEHEAIAELLDTGVRIPGCGHKVYADGDPRDTALHGAIAAAWNGDERVAVVEAVRAAATERSGRFTNIDMAVGALTWLIDADPGAGEAIFAVARTAGWLAHAMEEATEQPLRFRAEARYLSP